MLTKLNGFMSNMFGTKTKRDNDKEKETDTMASGCESTRDEGKASELKSAMEEFTSKIEKPNEGDKGASITPITRQRNNLGGRRNNTSSTIYMVEKPVNIGNDNSVGAGGGGGGSGLNSVNLQDSDAMKKGIKIFNQSYLQLMSASSPSIYEKFIIESADGSKTVDIASGVVNFTYYENLFSNTHC